MRFSDLTEDRLTVGMRDRLKQGLKLIPDEHVRAHIDQWIDATFTDAMNIPTYGGYGFEKKYAIPLGLAVHAVTDEHMREFLIDWTFQVFGGSQGMPFSEKDWTKLCMTGTAPKHKVPRPSPFKTFEERYEPVSRNANTRDYQRDRDQIPRGTPEELIWSVIAPESGRGADILMPGFDRHAHSYILCRRPFPPTEYSGLGYYF